ncbi:HemK2/MTQ2 family protein methyltransferase [Rhodococcus koreensis]|uniref:HemK2/MTQ2 family protein methyltransferase n=1 Tax=Rhodococcus koreensis TaxID=99653 RepID=UPI00197D3AD1|nr:HemK2/MTQ2 family protein methyltransferase [Rhodococcus koreensis]QSE84774.1 methyltransferase [Rhodococcus koreensis]
MLVRLPGVYPAQHDTWALVGALKQVTLGPDSRVLDLCAGSGVLSVCAAKQGAGRVTAVDVSRRAFATTWINARLHRRSVRVVRGDLTEPVRGERFDLVVSNPPYVPAEAAGLPHSGIARSWNAGTDGRAVLDRICVQVPDVLNAGGVLLLVQSALSGIEKSQTMLEERGLRVDVVSRVEVPFGPVLAARRDMLAQRGVIGPGQRSEELVVLRAVK